MTGGKRDNQRVHFRGQREQRLSSEIHAGSATCGPHVGTLDGVLKQRQSAEEKPTDLVLQRAVGAEERVKIPSQRNVVELIRRAEKLKRRGQVRHVEFLGSLWGVFCNDGLRVCPGGIAWRPRDERCPIRQQFLQHVQFRSWISHGSINDLFRRHGIANVH